MDLPSNSVLALAHLLRTGQLSARDLRRIYVERIRRLDPSIRAFVQFDDGAADKGDDNAGCAPGIPFGVKDVLDVVGFPTKAGSMSRTDVAPATADAAVVERLRTAGFTPIGKTASTEFAFVDPAATRNPHNLDHTPGGSSSGSGAAVAAGLIPFALGTQTAGSLCRPAAYCGVAAFKPTIGHLPTAGLVPLAPSFDTVGVIARHVADAAAIIGTCAAKPAEERAAAPASSIGVLGDRFHRSTSSEIGAFHEGVIRAAIQGKASVKELSPAISFEAVLADHRTVMLFEAFEIHGALLESKPDALRPRFREALHEGARITRNAAMSANERLMQAKRALWYAASDVGALILQPVPASAPKLNGTTGDQSYLTPWTVFGGPLVVVPGRLDRSGLPMASMIAAPPGNDSVAVATGMWLERDIDEMPPFVTPSELPMSSSQAERVTNPDR